MTEYKVFEYDFIKNRGDNMQIFNSFKEAKNEAYKIAKSFCEDEEPKFEKEQKNLWAYKTNCDFGSIIYRKGDQ